MPECCCCSTSAPLSPLTRDIRHSIDADNLRFFEEKLPAILNPRHGFVDLELYFIESLLYAIRRGRERILHYCLRNDSYAICRAKRLKSNFKKLVTHALKHSDRGSLKILLDCCPNKIDITSLRFGFSWQSVLHVSARYGNLDCLQFLIEEYIVQDDGYLNKKHSWWLDRQKHSPLFYAGEHGHLAVVKFLITKCGLSPLHKNSTKFFGRCTMDVVTEEETKDYLSEWKQRYCALVAFASVRYHEESPVSKLSVDLMKHIASFVPRN